MLSSPVIREFTPDKRTGNYDKDFLSIPQPPPGNENRPQSVLIILPRITSAHLYTEYYQ